MALVVLIDKISEALEMVVVLLGFSLIFQRPWILLTTQYYCKKMYFYGVHNITLSWFENYSFKKKEYVTYYGIKSLENVSSHRDLY